MTSITTFIVNTNTEAAYKQLYRDLDQIGVIEHIAHLEEDEILEVLKSGIIRDQG